MSHVARVGALVLFRQAALVDHVQLLVELHLLQDFFVHLRRRTWSTNVRLFHFASAMSKKSALRFKSSRLRFSRMIAHNWGTGALGANDPALLMSACTFSMRLPTKGESSYSRIAMNNKA